MIEAYLREHNPELYRKVVSEAWHYMLGWRTLHAGQECVSLVNGFSGYAGVRLYFVKFAAKGEEAGRWKHAWTGQDVVSVYGDDILIFRNSEGKEFGVKPEEFHLKIRVVEWYDELMKDLDQRDQVEYIHVRKEG